MRDVVVVASARTPPAKSFRGSFNLTRPDDLAAHCIQDVLRKTPQLSNGSAGVLLMERRRAEALGIKPKIAQGAAGLFELCI